MSVQPPASADSAAIPGIRLQDGFRFRDGQATFLKAFHEALRQGERSHLGVFVPGYGKTITALAAFVVAFRMGLANRLVVFVPRGNLRDQYADPEELQKVFRALGAPPFSFCVADSDRVFLKNLQTQVVITTYQYAAGTGGHKALQKYCAAGQPLFIFDEVHHLSEDGLWAQRIADLNCAVSVALSGTPMRSDNKSLFGVPHEVRGDGEQYYLALHEVTMRDAHAEGGILKRVEAHTVEYHLKMVRSDTGEEFDLSLSALRELGSSKEVDTYLARQRLRFHEVYLETLLRPAFERFADKRRSLALAYHEAQRGRGIGSPGQIRALRQHQMLIIAMSNKHAAAILAFVRQRFPGVTSGRIGQDVAATEREELLDAYRDGRLDVMVQVDMIGEGTDIKPISVIVKADLVRALSKTLQQVFRGMRYFDGFPDWANVCDLYAANDSDVVNTLEWIAREEQMGSKVRKEKVGGPGAPPPPKEDHSVWELKSVDYRDVERHTLELFGAPGAGQSLAVRRQPRTADVAEREKLLRQECADLANELAHAVRGMAGATTHGAAVRLVHGRAQKVFRKPQEALSLPELERKRAWLKKCLRAGRVY